MGSFFRFQNLTLTGWHYGRRIEEDDVVRDENYQPLMASRNLHCCFNVMRMTFSTMPRGIECFISVHELSEKGVSCRTDTSIVQGDLFQKFSSNEHCAAHCAHFE